MIMGINDKNMCVDCGEDFINATFSEYKSAIKHDGIDNELLERLSNHAKMLSEVMEEFKNLIDKKPKKK